MRAMRTLRALALGALVALPAGSALADGRLTLGLTGGTLGVGPELSLRPFEGIGMRANVTWLGFALNEDVDDIEYDGDVTLLSVGAMADWYPFDGGLRLSAGVRWNGNDLQLSARPSSDVTIGGVTYTPAEVGRLTGTVDANEVAPLVTLGWGAAARRAHARRRGGLRLSGRTEDRQPARARRLARSRPRPACRSRGRRRAHRGRGEVVQVLARGAGAAALPLLRCETKRGGSTAAQRRRSGSAGCRRAAENFAWRRPRDRSCHTRAV
jgi:hypothetical protein